ncbi:hypothetical protein BROUX41_004720 [Berkeleyomyces rouxiae]
MPRPRRPGTEPKRRSRTGCWPCKRRKIKCDEARPHCRNCERNEESCDYSIRLNWDNKRAKNVPAPIHENSLSTRAPANHRDGSLAIYQQPQPVKYNNASMSLSGKSITFAQTRESPRQAPPQPRQNHTFHQAQLLGSQDSGAPCTSFQMSLNFNTSPKTHQLPPKPSYSAQNPTEKVTPSRLNYRQHDQFPAFQPQKNDLRFSAPTALSQHADPFYPPRQPSATSSQSPSFLESLDENSPGTPAQSSSCSDEDFHPINARSSALSPLSQSHVSRVDVSSLLCSREESFAYPEMPHPPHISVKFSEAHLWDEAKLAQLPIEQAFLFGYDLGRKDCDLEIDNDPVAISPELPNDDFKAGSPLNPDDLSVSSAWCPVASPATDYYKKPVAIVIPRKYMPLPSLLAENPWHLLHHFLNHTAKVLMPYDDAERNPYRHVLPEIAVAEPHLLRLLLAYSASHRARAIGYTEPGIRMAKWITIVIPNVNNNLHSNNARKSVANLASAIILASLEIISPKVFGSQIGWQTHLLAARSMMEDKTFWRLDTKTKEGECCGFLWSWFVYLDILGSLSGGPWTHEDPSKWVKHYDRIVDDQKDSLDEINCITGFTVRCIRLLARVSNLCRKSDSSRITENRAIRPDWRPDQETIEAAEELDNAIHQSLKCNPFACSHIRPETVDTMSKAEIIAINEAFHWAALVHLHQRALGKPKEHNDVMNAVNGIVKCMKIVRPGTTGEMGILFPMFTAGCNTIREADKCEITRRFDKIEAHGMKQVSQARKLLVKVWQLNKPWETLLKNEFIG